MDLSDTSAWGGGSTHQRDVAITGVWGYSDVFSPAGTLVGSIDTTVTTLDVSNAAAVEVGHIIQLGTERMIVTERSWKSSGQTLQAPVTGQMNATTLSVADGSEFHPSEVIQLDAERM